MLRGLFVDSDSDTRPAFALSQNLGAVTSAQQSVVWALGLMRFPALQYTDLSNVVTNYSLYLETQYSNNIDELVSKFLDHLLRTSSLFNNFLFSRSTTSSTIFQMLCLEQRR